MTSTIALIEPEPYRYRRLSWPTWSYGTMADINSYEAFWRCPMEYEPLVPATELTTLLERCEKAEEEREAYQRYAAEKSNRYALAIETIQELKKLAELAERQRDEALQDASHEREMYANLSEAAKKLDVMVTDLARQLAEALVGVETMSAWRTHFAEQLYAAERQRDEALKALHKYGDHLIHCRYRGGHDCSCGLDDLRAARAAGGKNDKT